MTISCNNGSYEALTTDGRIIGFKNRDEAVACAELHCGIMRLLGHEKSLKDCFPDAVEQTEKKAVFEKKTVKFRSEECRLTYADAEEDLKRFEAEALEGKNESI